MKKVLIIGAGPAGLTAAHTLLKDGAGTCSVTVLERSGAIGGISRTVRYAGNRMDIGGHRFFSKSDRVMDWWRERMPLQGAPSYDDKVLGRAHPLATGGPDPEIEDRAMLVRTRVSRIYFRGKFFDYPISMKWETIRNMGFLTTMKAGFSYLASCVRKLPETSLENFYVNRFGRVLYSMFFEGYTEKLWGRHPREISADWGAQRVKGLSIRAVLKDMLSKVFRTKRTAKQVETSLIEEFWYPKLGPGQLWEQTAAEIREMGGEIRMETEVRSIRTEQGRVTGVVALQNGAETALDADYVISTMPVKDLVAGMQEAPADVRTAAAGLPYRDFVTVGLLLDRLKLKNNTEMKTLNGLVPDCWIYIQDVGVKLGRIQIFNNWSPYLVKDPAHTVWIGLEYFCAEGDGFWNLSEEETVRFALDELKKIGVVDADAVPLDAHRERVQKAYPAYFDTYSEMDAIIRHLDSYGNLLCIGRNGQHRYNNMDHSMLTGFEAADAVLSGNPDHSAVWNVNTEKAYHEEKGAE